jgi:hypothetical protein
MLEGPGSRRQAPGPEGPPVERADIASGWEWFWPHCSRVTLPPSSEIEDFSVVQKVFGQVTACGGVGEQCQKPNVLGVYRPNGWLVLVHDVQVVGDVTGGLLAGLVG